MDIERKLKEIERELRLGHAERPDQMLRKLLGDMGRESVAEWRTDIQAVVDEFQRKRRQALNDFLDARIKGRAHGRQPQAVGRSPAGVREPTASPPYPKPSRAATTDHEAEFRNDLNELGRKHIFQWSTSYRDCLFRHFGRHLSQVEAQADASLAAIRRPLSEHSHEIFVKGYGHERNIKATPHFGAVQKSIGGLARFLDLPLDYYSIQAANTHRQQRVLALRALFSAACLGILEGYAAVRFDRERGDSLLPKFSSRWGHNLAFLTPAAAKEVAELAEPGLLTEGVLRSVIPLLASIDRMINKQREDYFPLPLSSRFSWPERFLEVGLRAPRSASSRPSLEARAYLDAEHVFPRALTEAYTRNVAVVVAPLKSDVRAYVRDRTALSSMVVEADDAQPRQLSGRGTFGSRAVDMAEQVLSRTIYDLRSKRTGAAISHNIAREFPLDTPNPMPFYRVQRTSVRDLLRAFDRKNGVRLWCSVRRSGKTTACFGLDYTAADSVIVSQTCGTGPTDNARMFFDEVCNAAAAGSLLEADFVEARVEECSPVAADGRRKVLIVDEYETLFAFLRETAERDGYVRYTVVQPLLNQLTEFARDNLLVLLGQKPDAHFILMDQNQLAPYVRQDPFPLFEHDPGTRAGEFGELVGKVLTERIGCNPGFLEALHQETAGHPYLTVNVLCALVDWLIEQRRPYRGLKLDRADFTEFHEAKLRPSQMAMSGDYSFFREALTQAMSERGYRSNRWLFAVYWVLRKISRRDPEGLSIPKDGLHNVMETIPAPGPLGDPWDILRTATQANFLQYNEDEVGVKIRMLGRLAAAVRPGLV